ncbi:hypothetical protein [Aequorivita marina]|uniref:hypothetical protein n=1 Tax=Aequorivita marina TaxID=3073654 RepID=UPI002874366B|nr:hypothetical protein [Aequorivita sp. S2608]MDS1297577.1 hypothetical protein [Aequorivita sp. S2608]
MKKWLFLIALFPLLASAQFDFETNKFKLDFVDLPEIESLMTSSLPSNSNLSNTYSNKLPSFKLSKENYREPVSMFEAVTASENTLKSNITISLDPREYGVFTSDKNLRVDGATKVRNAVYEDASQPFLYHYPSYNRRNRSTGFGIYGGYSPYRYGHRY